MAGSAADFPPGRHACKEIELLNALDYDEIIMRDKVHLDVFYLKDQSREESANCPIPA